MLGTRNKVAITVSQYTRVHEIPVCSSACLLYGRGLYIFAYVGDISHLSANNDTPELEFDHSGEVTVDVRPNSKKKGIPLALTRVQVRHSSTEVLDAGSETTFC